MAGVRHFYAAESGNSLFRQASRRLPGGDVVAGGEGEYSTNDIVDARDAAQGAVLVVPLELDRAVHQTAGIDGVVRRVKNAATVQLRAQLFGFELIVRATRDDATTQSRQGVLVD